MANSLENLVESIKNAIKYWWLLLIAGILLCATGVIVFFYPGEAYLTLAILFGVVLLVTGIIQLVLAIANKNYFTRKAWAIVGSVLEIILGLILCFNIPLSAMTLPFILGFWLMYRGFMYIAFGSDLSTFHIKGYGWSIACGILLIIGSIFILLDPVLFGTSMVVAFLGISFVFSGISSCYAAFQLKNIHEKAKEIFN